MEFPDKFPIKMKLGESTTLHGVRFSVETCKNLGGVIYVITSEKPDFRAEFDGPDGQQAAATYVGLIWHVLAEQKKNAEARS